MEIRKTTLQDVDTVLDVFAAAKRYMRANGNASQWGDEYPDRSIVTYDIACGSSYVMLEHGEIVGTFALFLGEDESYRVIEDGAVGEHQRTNGVLFPVQLHHTGGRADAALQAVAAHSPALLRLLHRADRLSARRHARG